MRALSLGWMTALLLVSWPGRALAEAPDVEGWSEVAHRVEARISRGGGDAHRAADLPQSEPPLPRGGPRARPASGRHGAWLRVRVRRALDGRRPARRGGRPAPLRGPAARGPRRAPARRLAVGRGRLGVAADVERAAPEHGDGGYTVRTRPGYAHGRSSFTYPAGDGDAPRPVLTRGSSLPGTDWRITPGTDALEVSWVPERPTRVEARLGLLPLGTGTLGFLQIQAPPRLAPVPERPRVCLRDGCLAQHGRRGHRPPARHRQCLSPAAARCRGGGRGVPPLRGAALRPLHSRLGLDGRRGHASPGAARARNGSHLDRGLRLAQQVLMAGGVAAAYWPSRLDGSARRMRPCRPPVTSTSTPPSTCCGCTSPPPSRMPRCLSRPSRTRVG